MYILFTKKKSRHASHHRWATVVCVKLEKYDINSSIFNFYVYLYASIIPSEDRFNTLIAAWVELIPLCVFMFCRKCSLFTLLYLHQSLILPNFCFYTIKRLSTTRSRHQHRRKSILFGYGCRMCVDNWIFIATPTSRL